jgi:hypothetical protein
MRKYAMHTKGHAALSLIYAEGEDLPKEVAQKLEKAAALYEIELPRKTITKTASKKTSFLKDDYLLPEQKMCKVASAGDVKLGLEFLKRNSGSLDVMSAAHANKVLCKKAQDFEVEVPVSVYQEAGLTMCNLEKLGEWLETRALVAKEPKYKEAYTKLASVLDPKSKEPITRETLLKVATTIAVVDEEAGMVPHYNKRIATPMGSVFNTEKIAEETMYFGGVNIPSSQFAKLNEDVYAKVLGDDVLEEIMTDGSMDSDKVMDIMRTLPADLQQALVPYLMEA